MSYIFGILRLLIINLMILKSFKNPKELSIEHFQQSNQLIRPIFLIVEMKRKQKLSNPFFRFQKMLSFSGRT